MKGEKILPIVVLIFCFGGYALNDYLSDSVQIILVVLFISLMLGYGILSEYRKNRTVDKHHIVIYSITFIGLIIFSLFNVLEIREEYILLEILIPIIFIICLLSIIFHGVIKAGDKDKISINFKYNYNRINIDRSSSWFL